MTHELGGGSNCHCIFGRKKVTVENNIWRRQIALRERHDKLEFRRTEMKNSTSVSRFLIKIPRILQISKINLLTVRIETISDFIQKMDKSQKFRWRNAIEILISFLPNSWRIQKKKNKSGRFDHILRYQCDFMPLRRDSSSSSNQAGRLLRHISKDNKRNHFRSFFSLSHPQRLPDPQWILTALFREVCSGYLSNRFREWYVGTGVTDRRLTGRLKTYCQLEIFIVGP